MARSPSATAPDARRSARLLGELEAASRGRLVFAVPSEVRWSLPAYELALLSAAHLRARGVSGIEISLATHEPRPLELLGESAPEVVGELLAEAGIELRTRVRAASVRTSAARAAGRRRDRRGPRRRPAGARGPRDRRDPAASARLHPDRRPAQRRGADRRLGRRRRDLVSDQAGRARRPAGRCRRRGDRRTGGRPGADLDLPPGAARGAADRRPAALLSLGPVRRLRRRARARGRSGRRRRSWRAATSAPT